MFIPMPQCCLELWSRKLVLQRSVGTAEMQMVKINVCGYTSINGTSTPSNPRPEKHYEKWVKRAQEVDVMRSGDQSELVLSRYYMRERGAYISYQCLYHQRKFLTHPCISSESHTYTQIRHKGYFMKVSFHKTCWLGRRK